MQQFEITLRNEKTRFYDRFALFIFLLNGVSIILLMIYFPRVTENNNVIAMLIALAALLTIGPLVLISKGKAARYINVIYSASFAIILFWIFLGFWWVGLSVMILVYLYGISKRELIVSVATDKILYPSFPTKNIAWKDLNNLILKDRLLTIDFRNNKIIQQDIDAKSYALKEEEFNDFCTRQLALAASHKS